MKLAFQGENLVIANLGDSRAILGTKTEEGIIVPVQLTTDLKPGLHSKTDLPFFEKNNKKKKT